MIGIYRVELKKKSLKTVSTHHYETLGYIPKAETYLAYV